MPRISCAEDFLCRGSPASGIPSTGGTTRATRPSGFPVPGIPRHKIPMHCGFPVPEIVPRPRFYCVPPCYCVSPRYCASSCYCIPPRRSVSLYCLFSVPQRVCLPQRVCYAAACATPRLASSRSLHPPFISSPHHALGEFIEHRLGWRHEHYPTYSFFCGFRSFSQRDAAGVRPADVRTVDVRTVSICPANIRHDVRH